MVTKERIEFYEQSLEGFKGLRKKRRARVLKRVATTERCVLIVEDEEDRQFSVTCPDWMFKKAYPGMTVGLVYRLCHERPDEFREKLLGINRLSPNGQRIISWTC